MQIGSIFELDLETFGSKGSNYNNKGIPTFGYEYQMLFNTGRSTIKYLFQNIIKLRKDEYILLPAYLCTSIIDALEQVNVKYDFYNIDSQLNIDIKDLEGKVTDKTRAVFFIQYFGFVQSKEVMRGLMGLSKKNIVLIEDLTQSMFSTHKYLGIGDYALASIRKWFAIPDGAMLCSKEYLSTQATQDGCNTFMVNYLIAQILKDNYHKKGDKASKSYRDYIRVAEEALEVDTEIRKISNVSYELLQKYDYDLLINRKYNYYYLMKELSNIEQVKLIYHDLADIIPLGCPVRVERKSELSKYLCSNKVYCPTHWPLNDTLYARYPHLKELYESLLTIPCDQRYTQEDMKRIVELIKEFYSQA